MYQAAFTRTLLGCALAVGLCAPLASAPAADRFRILYAFKGGSDGSYPQAVIRDKAGNLYGTTTQGGSYNSGTVIRFGGKSGESVLHSFGGGGDGANPAAGLIRDRAGILYGTTQDGGATGKGTVFVLTPDGNETVLHAFKGRRDGAGPEAGLLKEGARLYGTTASGGAHGQGVFFRLAADGRETVLHAFAGGDDGAEPLSAAIADAAGNFYGTTYLGGTPNHGTVYKVSPDGNESVLYSFSGGSDGGSPVGGLIADAKGNFYGTTVVGGSEDAGTVYEITPDGSESVLWSFTGEEDGANPESTLVFDSSGNLYGTARISEDDGDGNVFRLTPDDTLTTLHSFGGRDGADPFTGLAIDAHGRLYGTAPIGGAHGYGVIFTLGK